jgi:hypothetical protein
MSTTIVLDGVEVGTTVQDGIFCSSGGTIAVTNSLIDGASGAGIHTTNCTVIIDANEITNNHSGGIVIDTGTTYVMTNNTIHDNSGVGTFGVQLNDTRPGSYFAFNTVAVNGPGTNTAAGGVICNNVKATIMDSIIASNSKTSDTGTQIGGTMCSLQSVVVGTDSTVDTGAIKKPPQLTSDGHLDLSSQSAVQLNSECCINQLGTPSTPNSDHDVDRTARPKGTGSTPYDIGAQEAQ